MPQLIVAQAGEFFLRAPRRRAEARTGVALARHHRGEADAAVADEGQADRGRHEFAVDAAALVRQQAAFGHRRGIEIAGGGMIEIHAQREPVGLRETEPHLAQRTQFAVAGKQRGRQVRAGGFFETVFRRQPATRILAPLAHGVRGAGLRAERRAQPGAAGDREGCVLERKERAGSGHGMRLSLLRRSMAKTQHPVNDGFCDAAQGFGTKRGDGMLH